MLITTVNGPNAVTLWKSSTNDSCAAMACGHGAVAQVGEDSAPLTDFWFHRAKDANGLPLCNNCARK